MKLLADRVAVLVDVIDNSKTESGIILATQPTQQPNTGTVTAVGPGRILNSGETIPVALKEGDRVVFNQYSGTKISLDGQEYLILREGDILGVI